MTDIPTVLSAAHKKVIKFLERWGIELMEEVDFPPYRVDIYIPEFHVAVEVDGPHHSKKADEKRNEKLLEDYFLPTFRIKIKDIRGSRDWGPRLVTFFEKYEDTACYRWELCKPKTPHL